MHLNTIFIALLFFLKKSESWNPAIAGKVPPMKAENNSTNAMPQVLHSTASP